MATMPKPDLQYGIEPIFIVTFWWGGMDFQSSTFYTKYCTSYAYKEIEEPYFPVEDGFAFGFLKSLSGFDNSIQLEGFGQVNQLSAEFTDFFGHFKYWMDTRNLYKDLMVEVHIYFHNLDDNPDNKRGTWYKIFEGKIREPVVWTEADRTFKCDLVTDTLFRDLGFVPSMDTVTFDILVPDDITNPSGTKTWYRDNIDSERTLLQQCINHDVWPQLFGYVNDYVIKPIANVPEFEVSDYARCFQGSGSQYAYMVASVFCDNSDWLTQIVEQTKMVVPFLENNKFLSTVATAKVDKRALIFNSYQSYLHPEWPVGKMTMDIETDGEFIRCGGYLIDKYFFITDFNMLLYTAPISCKLPIKYVENPAFIDWNALQPRRNDPTLSPEARAFAAMDNPVYPLTSPDYEPSMLLLPHTRIKLTEEVISGADTFFYEKMYANDSDIQLRWYFSLFGEIYVVTELPEAGTLKFSPTLPALIPLPPPNPPITMVVFGGMSAGSDHVYLSSSYPTPKPGDTFEYDGYTYTITEYIPDPEGYAGEIKIEPVLETELPEGLVLEGQTPVETTPILNIDFVIDILAPDTPWLQDTYIAIRTFTDFPNLTAVRKVTPAGAPIYLCNGYETTDRYNREGQENLPAYVQESQGITERLYYAHVVKQIGPRVYVENIVDERNHSHVFGSFTYATEITEVTGNLRLKPNEFEMRVSIQEDVIQPANSNFDRRRIREIKVDGVTEYASEKCNKYVAEYIIKPGAKARIIDWWATYTYVVTTDIGQIAQLVYPGTLIPLWWFQVMIENVWVKINDHSIPILGPQFFHDIDALDQFQRNDYTEYTIKLFLPERRSPAEMHDYFNGVYYPTEESLLLYWPNHVSITLKPTQFNLMLRGQMDNNASVDLHVSACNSINTDEKIARATIENHSAFFYMTLGQVYTAEEKQYDPLVVPFEHQCMTLINDTQDIKSFLGQVAFENAKVLQIRGNSIALIDLFKMYNPMVVFNEANIDAKSMTIEYKTFEEIVTRYKIAMPDGRIWTMKTDEQIGPFEIATFTDLMIGRDLSGHQERQIDIKFNLVFRPDDFNITLPLFDGYVKVFTRYEDFLKKQRPEAIRGGTYLTPVHTQWFFDIPLIPTELRQRSVCSVLRWWLHYQSKIWRIVTFRTYITPDQLTFYLRPGDIVKFELNGPIVKLFTDEIDLLNSPGYPIDMLNDEKSIATNFDHEKIKYYTAKKEPWEYDYCTGLAMVLGISVDPEEWLVTVKCLWPVE